MLPMQTKRTWQVGIMSPSKGEVRISGNLTGLLITRPSTIMATSVNTLMAAACPKPTTNTMPSGALPYQPAAKQVISPTAAALSITMLKRKDGSQTTS